mgnify:CR=1 FL=1
MPINGGFSFRKCVWSMEKKKLSLPKQIGIALLLGILAGYVFYMLGIPEFTTNYLKPFGTIFVNLLKFIVVPVVLLSMIDGIISMGDMKKVGSVGCHHGRGLRHRPGIRQPLQQCRLVPHARAGGRRGLG